MATDVLVENNFLKKWKKSGLWDCGVATGGSGQKPDRKKRLGLSDSGMASGRLIIAEKASLLQKRIVDEIDELY